MSFDSNLIIIIIITFSYLFIYFYLFMFLMLEVPQHNSMGEFASVFSFNFYVQFFKISLFLRYKYTLAHLQQNIFNKKLNKLFLHIVHVTLTSLQ